MPLTGNMQSPEPFDVTTGEFIDLHSCFHTLQGEGPFAGRASVFIRLAGCNLMCPGCDTEYTLGRKRMKAHAVAERALREKYATTTLAVITGGEPFRQNIDDLVDNLLLYFELVQIESNGVLKIGEGVKSHIAADRVALVVSPKTSAVSEDARKWAHVFKYVVQAGQIDLLDGLPTTTLGHKATPRVARPPQHLHTSRVYVNPMDEKDAVRNRANVTACRDIALQYGYTCGAQLHKLWDLP